MIPPIFMYYSSVHQSILSFENILFASIYYPLEQFKVHPKYFILYRDKLKKKK